MKLYLLAALTLTLIGCASSGPKIKADRLNEVRRGETTIAQVINRFGRPSVRSKNMDGTHTAAYMHAGDRADAAAFVPLMTALAGKADANVDSVIFYFDAKGVLSDYRTTQATPAKPALARAETATPPDPSKPAETRRAEAAETKRAERKPAGDFSDPWKIQLYPSGYRENR